MAKEKVEKVEKVKFSLPYRQGMEKENGYTGKVTLTSKTWPGEKEFARFEIEVDHTIPVSDEDALETGRKVLRQNKTRAKSLNHLATKYGVNATGSATLTAQDRKILALLEEVSGSREKAKSAFLKRFPGKEIALKDY